MIQANELRVGNWVYDRVNKKEVQITEFTAPIHPISGIAHPKIGYMRDANTCWLHFESTFKPIRLTPEVMERVECKSINYFMNEGAVWVLMSGTPHVCTTLHQLQNLIFALTGEEITYKP